MESSTGASARRSSSIGLTLVRRKWSGQLVPSAASAGAFSEARKSSTTSESVKCPTIGLSVEARSEEHTSELQSLMRISYAVFCLKKKNDRQQKKNKVIDRGNRNIVTEN